MRHPPRSALLPSARPRSPSSGAMTAPGGHGGRGRARLLGRVLRHQPVGQRLPGRRQHHQQHGAPLSSWSLTFDFAGGQKVTQGWNAKWSQSGTHRHRGQRELQRRARHRRSVSAGLPRLLVGQQPRPDRLHAQRHHLQRPTATTADTDARPPHRRRRPHRHRRTRTTPTPARPPCTSSRQQARGRRRQPPAACSASTAPAASSRASRATASSTAPSTTPPSQAIADWKANTVRIPLNEDCWLGLSNIQPAYGGANYIDADQRPGRRRSRRTA